MGCDDGYPFQSFFNRWLRKHRLNPVAAAPRLGIGHTAAYDWAAGRSAPTRTRAHLLAHGFGIEARRLERILDDDRIARCGR